MNQRFDTRLVSMFKVGDTRIEKLNDGSWEKMPPDPEPVWNPKRKNPSYWQVWFRMPVHSLAESIKIFPPMHIEKCVVRSDAPKDIRIEITPCPGEGCFLIEFFSNQSGHSQSPATTNLDVLPEEEEDLEPDFDES